MTRVGNQRVAGPGRTGQGALLPADGFLAPEGKGVFLLQGEDAFIALVERELAVAIEQMIDDGERNAGGLEGDDFGGIEPEAGAAVLDFLNQRVTVQTLPGENNQVLLGEFRLSGWRGLNGSGRKTVDDPAHCRRGGAGAAEKHASQTCQAKPAQPRCLPGGSIFFEAGKHAENYLRCSRNSKTSPSCLCSIRVLPV